MSIIRVTKEFSFEMAHTLVGYDGACREIHGHSYRLFVTVKGMPISDPLSPKCGMVMDFGELKRIVHTAIIERYDHALLMRRTSRNNALVEIFTAHYDKFEATDYQPTCENLVDVFARMIREQLPENVCLHAVKLYETATSFAQWYAADN